MKEYDYFSVTVPNSSYIGDPVLTYQNYTTWPTYWTYPTTIYMYQITCPKCETMNWMQLDKVTPCTKCKSKIKAVTEKVDYEVPVTT